MDQQFLQADEVLLARAEANGYKRGAHKEVDEVRSREKHVAKTKKDQDRTLRRYVLWRMGAMKEDRSRTGLPGPDEETARRDCLRSEIAAPDLSTVKDFLRFYVATSRPCLDADKPTVDSINTVADWQEKMNSRGGECRRQQPLTVLSER